MTKNGYEKIAYPETYTNEDELHAILKSMRDNDPVCWLEPSNYRPFWAITKHSDISDIELKNDFFINDPRTTLMDITAENYIKEFTGGSHLLVRTLVHMDNPDHKVYRAMTQSWFSPPNLIKLKSEIEILAKNYVDKMLEAGSECDFVRDISALYPLRVIMTILGVPPEDEGLMLKLTQQLFGGNDEDMKRIFWRDGGVHQNITHAVHPDPISGMHCWHQKVRLEKAKLDDNYGDVFVDTGKSTEVYRRWLKKTRPAPGPEGLRRPLWLKRPLKPAEDQFYFNDN